MNPVDTAKVAAVALAVTGAYGVRTFTTRPGPVLDWATGAVLGSASVWWLAVNGPYEIRVLWTVAPTHGLTIGDFPGLATGGLAALLWLRAARARAIFHKNR